MSKVYCITVTIAEALKFPSVKAQEVMMQVAGCGDLQSMKPDLFDPALDEANRKYQFFIQSLHELKDLEAILSQCLAGDAEIAFFRVESVSEPKPLPEAKTEKKPRQLRIDSGKLEELNRLAGELVILKEQVASISSQMNQVPKTPELAEVGKALTRSVHSLHEVVGEIQDRAREFQQIPMGSLLQRFQRVARDVSRQLGKKIECVIDGGETEVDGNVLERVGDLLIHLIRNAADHGIESAEERRRKGKSETGLIRLLAYHEEDQVVIEVSDDGGGIDPQKVGAKALKLGFVDQKTLESMEEQEILKFIFRSGFSTAEGVSEVSGRGVGLDVVKSRSEELNGLLDFRSEPGKGTTFLIRLPLSASIVQALLISQGGEVFALPLASVMQVMRVGQRGMQSESMHLISLAKILGSLRSNPRAVAGQYLIELGFGVDRYELIVDQVLGRREIVIRPLSHLLGRVPGIGGMATLGDGRTVIVLDPRSLFERQKAAAGELVR